MVKCKHKRIGIYWWKNNFNKIHICMRCQRLVKHKKNERKFVLDGSNLETYPATCRDIERGAVEKIFGREIVDNV